MNYFILVLLLCGTLTTCSQSPVTTAPVSKKVGGPCEGCEAIYESPVPFTSLPWIDALPDFSEAGPKLEVSGTVYQQDGKTPAPGIVLYIYHTDQQGYYSKKGNETGWGKRHGSILGWMKTNAKGRYKFYTLKPVSYPNSTIPAHIHITIKEPDKNEYYIDEFLFEDDPFITKSERSRQEGRGGSGIVQLHSGNGMLIATRNIILGKNIPDYPVRFSDNGTGLSLNLLSALR